MATASSEMSASILRCVRTSSLVSCCNTGETLVGILNVTLVYAEPLETKKVFGPDHGQGLGARVGNGQDPERDVTHDCLHA